MSTSALCVYTPSTNAQEVYISNSRVSTRAIGMSLTRAAWVKINRLRTGVGRFASSMHKWGLVSSANCECGASEKTANHVILTYPTHWAPRRIMGLIVLDDKTRCSRNSITASICSGQHSRLRWRKDKSSAPILFLYLT